MNVGDIIAKLIAVRGSMQTALGLHGNAGDEMTDAVGKIEGVLSGSEHELVAEGLDLWRRAETELSFIVQKLAAGDDSLADYMEVLSPGAGTRSAAIAKPTGEELLKRSKESTERKSLFSMLASRGDEVEDATKTLGKDAIQLANTGKPDERPPTFGSGETTALVEVTHRHPIMKAPDPPAPDAGQMLNLVLMGTAVSVKLTGMVKNAWKNPDRGRRDE